ncbi:MAG: TRAP transporter small permease [Verrucomicrobia bacterium]|nr:TRAP transporter small permease [Verrucomicrobiota bacterium]
MNSLTARIRESLVRLLEWTVIILMASLVLDVIWQVATRYLLKNPSSWTDELATLLIIWVALLGASVAFIRQGHLGVDFLTNKLRKRHREMAAIAVQALVVFFAGQILIYGGIKLVLLTLLTQQVSPALGIKMGHVYLALPISGFFIALFALENIVTGLRRLRAKSHTD